MKGTLHVDDYGLTVSDRGYTLPASQSNPRPLSYWRQLFAKAGGYMPGIDGEQVPVSLEPWAHAPEDTLLAIYIYYLDPEKVGTFDPAGPPNS